MEWDPTQFFRESDDPPANFALLVLNQPINERAFGVLRKHACLTICADGGANRFYEMMKSHGRESTELPNTIIGDLDSIRPSIRTHYEELGVNVIQDPDQYSTDFTKCLNYLDVHAAEIIAGSSSSSHSHSRNNRLDILILGGLGGRVDQAFSQIHHLYLMIQQLASKHDAADVSVCVGNLYLISEESITFILKPGEHTIHTPRTNRPGEGEGDNSDYYLLEENIGIIPLSGPARITTYGLQWDVTDWLTEIGGQISTSNHIRADAVGVETRVPVLFTLELAERLKRVR